MDGIGIMQGKVCLVTGATNGIGKISALELACMGATVIVVGRNPQKLNATVADIRAAAGHERVYGEQADLSLMAEVRALARRIEADYDRLDVLLNNAGGIFTSREVTAEGLEMTFALNHISYFLLTHELLDLLKSSAPARVVNVSSGAHQAVSGMNFDDLQSKKRYVGFSAYGRSKLANVLFTYELARRLAGTGVTVNALHPGAVSTGFGINNRGIISQLMFRVFQVMTMSPQEGAQTSIYLASSPEVANVTGSYFDRSRAVRSSPASYDESAQRRLWEMSEAIAGIREVEYA